MEAVIADSKIMAEKAHNFEFTLPSLESIEAAWQTAENLLKPPCFDLRLLDEQENMLSLLSHQEDLLAHKLVQLKSNCAALKEILADEVTRRWYEDLSYSKQSYQWSISMVETLLNPICKGKYFDLKVCLKPLGAASFPIDTLVPVSLVLLTSTTPAVEIPENVLGRPILRGETKSMLKYDSEFQLHTAKFRVQVTEVTSHFINGWVRLAVVPEPGESEIAPFVFNNLVVRAKERTCRKFRERQTKGKRQHRIRNFGADY